MKRTKNREGRTFPLFPELRALLERAFTRGIQLEQDRIIPWVFHRNGKPIRSFRKSWATACRFERYNIVSEGDLREAGVKLTGTFTGTVAQIAVDSNQLSGQNVYNGPVAQADRAEVS